MNDWTSAYVEIEALLASIPEIRFIDIWSEQPFAPEENYPFSLPAAFIEMNAPVIEDLGNNNQILYAEIRIYLLVVPARTTHHNSTDHQELLEYGAILRKIYQVLQGVAGTSFGPCTRISLTHEKELPYEWLYSQTFKTTIVDSSAAGTDAEGEAEEMNLTRGGIPEVTPDNTYDV